MVKGDRLKALRKEKGLTQSQLGELIGVKNPLFVFMKENLEIQLLKVSLPYVKFLMSMLII